MQTRNASAELRTTTGTVRSQPGLPLTASWPVPNTVIQSLTGRLPPGGLASGNTSIDILDNDRRLYPDNRRTQIPTPESGSVGAAGRRRRGFCVRFAKILNFGKTRADVGVDLGNLLNTNYATTYETTYQYTVGNTATAARGTIYTPRFVRWNLTVDF